MKKNNFVNRLFKPVDFYSLNLFRIFFGIVLVLQFISYTKADFIDKGILTPLFLFPFDLFPFIKPLPDGFMKLIPFILLVTAILIIFNKFFRIAVTVYLIFFSYLFLLEESYYNNHFYLIILLCFFFIFYKPVNTGVKNISVIPYWLLFLFQLQFFIVYFYGGIAKLNHDWLFNQQPVRVLLSLNAKDAIFPDLLNSEFAVYYIAYGGILFDLIIGFLLFYKPTFKIAVTLNILFHLTNLWIFNFGEGGDIGIFPILMIASNILFAEPEWVKKQVAKINLFQPVDVKKIKHKSPDLKIEENFLSKKNIVLPLLIVYLLLQFLLPFRHLLIPGNADWTSQAQWFSWRMKVHSKQVTTNFTIKRNENDSAITVNTGMIINTMQANMMGQNADMIYKFTNFLKKELQEKSGIPDPVINAEIKVSFNGRAPQYFVEPNLNLSKITYSPWKHSEWILPLKEK